MYMPVLVTGASSGIGEAVAVRLAQYGFKVWAGARRINRMKALEGLGQGRITAIELDVTDEGSIGRALRTINEDGAPLFGLVNNAGVSVTGPIEELQLNEWRRQFETNVFGLVAMTKAVVPQMREAGRGRVINIGSIAGRIVPPFMGAYAGSKHAVEGITDGMRREFALHGLKVSLIRPGFINTAFGEQEQEGLVPFMAEGRPYANAVSQMKAWHAKGHPQGASSMDVADAVLDALTAKRPHGRYTVPKKYIGPLMLRNLAPSAIVDRLFARITGVNGG